MSSPLGPQGLALTQPIPVPTLTVLPPSSDTESWSRSPSPRPSRSGRRSRFHRSRTCTKKWNNEEQQGLTSKRQWGKKTHVAEEELEEIHCPSPSPAPSISSHMVAEDEPRQDSLSQDLLLPPSCSWSRSPSPSRRFRWSLRSLLSRDSDWESCRLVGPIKPSWPIRGFSLIHF